MTAPFGIELHGALSKYEVLEPLNELKYRIVAPNPHPFLASYIVQATDDLGIVWIKGIGDAIQVNRFGSEIISLIDRTAEQVKIKYLKNRKFDFLSHGSIWSEPQDWMEGLYRGERYYSYVYDSEAKSSLPSDVSSIFVGCTAFSNGEAALTVEYASPRMVDASSEIEDSLSSYF